MKKTFKKYDKIRHNKKTWQCITSDSELAVFGKVTPIKGGGRTSYEETFIVSNTKALQDGFQYSRI